jgi:serine protease Do
MAGRRKRGARAAGLSVALAAALTASATIAAPHAAASSGAQGDLARALGAEDERRMTRRMEAPPEVSAVSRAYVAAAKALGPSVVRIQAVWPLRDAGEGAAAVTSAPPARTRSRVGSGVILDSRGYVVTNRHVVVGADTLTVTLQGGAKATAQLVGDDLRTDLALLLIVEPPSDLVAARLADSDQVEVGQWVLAIGNPLGLRHAVTAGIVSGRGADVGRTRHESGPDYIQTDAKINPGNSGGPLVNLAGEVIGINSLVRGGAGGAYGFALPANEVKRIARTLFEQARASGAGPGARVRGQGVVRQGTAAYRPSSR